MTAVTTRPVPFRQRFRFSQLGRRTFWPVWLGLGLLVLALSVPWSAEAWASVREYCGGYGTFGCTSGYEYTRWRDSSWGGGGAGEWTFAVLGIGAAAVLWTAARRDLARPTWFSRVPTWVVGAGLVVAVLNLGGIIPGTWFETSESGLISGGEPGWGILFTGLATWPLHRGLRRVRRTLDEANPAA